MNQPEAAIVVITPLVSEFLSGVWEAGAGRGSPLPSVRRRHLHEAEAGGVGEDVLEEAEGRDPLARPLVVPQEHQEAGRGALRDDPGGGGGVLAPSTPLCRSRGT